jgi:hypothetical protein
MGNFVERKHLICVVPKSTIRGRFHVYGKPIIRHGSAARACLWTRDTCIWQNTTMAFKAANIPAEKSSGS